MYVRNVLKPSDFVTFVPVGISATLQYNDRGIIEKVYRGGRENKVDITSDILPCVQGSAKKPFPFKISLKGGTTWVSGVIYTTQTFITHGELPDCIHDDMVRSYQDDPDKFNFFAGNVSSMAASFRGATHVRKWLSMSGFDVLPGSLVPRTVNSDSFLEIVNRSGFQFNPCHIAAYMIFRGNDCINVNTKIKQYVANCVHVFNDEYGNIKAKIEFKDTTDFSPVVDYSDVVKHNIQTGSRVVFDMYNNIVSSDCVDGKKRDKRSNKYVCTDCGLSFTVAESGLISCPNPECTSKMYPRICKLTKTLNMPLITYDSYRKLVKTKQILSVLDVFELSQYKELTISTTLAKLLQAIVPVTVVPKADVFTVLANKCTNNVDTFLYYINHPDKILSSLNIVNRDSQKLVAWLNDPNNATDVVNLINMPNIMIKLCDKKFEGAPLLRTKTIYITGKFVHGSVGDIIAILQSYSAKVVTELDSSDINCVIVGDSGEDINSVAVRTAKTFGAQIFTESEFFNMYQIDEDLQSNLV